MLALIYFLIIGLAAGWLAAILMKGRSLGLLGNMAVGVVGAVLGGYLFNIVGDVLGRLICATMVAVLFLYLLQKFGVRI